MAVLSLPHEALSRIDWNFPNAGTKPGSVHSLHWFPGNFIPQIPGALIQALSAPGDLVLDPFGGSGTTLVEGVRLGRHTVHSDLLSPAALVAAGKLAVLQHGLDGSTQSFLLNALTWESMCRTEQVGENGEGSDQDLEAWYAPDTLGQLRYIWKLIEQLKNPSQRAIVEMLFSDILFSCAAPGEPTTGTGKRRRHHWGWVADNVAPRALKEHSVIQLFTHRLQHTARIPRTGGHGRGYVLREDARRLSAASNSVDLIVTSPPYIGVIDYARAHRLLYLWENWSLQTERTDEIGARFKRFRKPNVGDYLDNMRDCWQELHRVMRVGAYCAVVIGESRRFPGTATETLRELEQRLPRVWGPVTRSPSRRRVSERLAREPIEIVCVFQKTDS
jgi:hypothetical protein